MPYLGRDLNQGNYLKLDDISSQFDGSKVSFDLTAGGSNGTECDNGNGKTLTSSFEYCKVKSPRSLKITN